MSKKYFDYAQYESDQYLESLEKRLEREYLKASQEVEKKMKKHLADFERKDAERRALVDSGEWTKDEYREWRANQIYISGRWNDLRNTLAEDYVNTNQIAAQMISNNNYDVYALNHNYAAFEIERTTGADLSYSLYNRKAVENLAKGNKDLPLKTKIAVRKDLRWNKKQIDSAMIQGILQGKSIPDIAKSLPRAVGETNLNGAIRRARTLTTYAQNEARLDEFREAAELGIEMQKCWLATLDNRTRDSHAIIDGECVDLDENFSNGLKCPGDSGGDASEVYNCRCTMVAQIKGYEKDMTELSARNIDHLESDYETWYSNHTPYEWEDMQIKTKQIQERTSKAIEKERRKQIDTGYTGMVGANELDDYNKNALNQIMSDTGYNEKIAKQVQADMQEYLGGDYKSFVNGHQKERVERIDKAIDRMPAYDGPIYRGMYVDESAIKQYADTKSGDIIHMKSISSWSSKEGVATGYSNILEEKTSSVLLECVNNKTSAGVQHISKWGTQEAEVLAKSTSEWEIIESKTVTKYEYLKTEYEEKLRNFKGIPPKRKILENTYNDILKHEKEYKKVCVIKIKVKEL